jgi:hypothetical protein
MILDMVEIMQKLKYPNENLLKIFAQKLIG